LAAFVMGSQVLSFAPPKVPTTMSPNRNQITRLPMVSSESLRSQINEITSMLGGIALQSQVYIIGTGLSNRLVDLPLSTLSILSRADVVLSDSLSIAHEELSKVVPRDCVIRDVGKRGDYAKSAKQSDIDQLILEYATTTTANNATGDCKKTIVRLKGGDPFLFGRSRTEIDVLREHSISYQVIPNLSSCVAGPHYGGIPLTDPLIDSQSFAVFSGTNAQGKSDTRNWGEVDVDALVFLMIGRLDKLGQLCVELGASVKWDKGTPCAVVQNAGRSTQKVWRATIGTLVDTIRKDLSADASTISPAIFIVGSVASLNLLSQTENDGKILES